MQSSTRLVRRLAWDHRRLRAAASFAAAAGIAAVAASTLADARSESRVATLAQPHVWPRRAWPSSAAVQSHESLPLGFADLRQHYRVDSVIGRGGFGLVHEGRDKRSDQRVAIKRVCKQTTTKAKFLQEVEILRAVGGRHHVLSLCEAFETADAYVLVTELVAGEELFEHLVAHGTFVEGHAQALVRDVANALAYLHAHGVVHGDLKPENILVDASAAHTRLRVKLIDFGQAFREHVASERSRCMGSGVATIAYAAPEVLATATTTSTTTTVLEAAGSAIDMWGLGVVLYILLCGFHPFDPENDATDAQLVERIQRGAFDERAPEWTQLPAPARDLIRRLLQVDPTQRPSADEVLAHAWLAKVEGAHL